MPHESHCAVPGRTTEPSELRRRVKQLEQELRAHDVDEGYEWPVPDDAAVEVPPESVEK